MKVRLIIPLTILSFAARGQMPGTDIWLMDVDIRKDTVVFSGAENITQRKGYDNQPAFSADGSFLLYTSMRDEKQTDIFRYDLRERKSRPFTNTATSEYSPTFMPDGKHISVVMVEPDSVQRLWKFPLRGGKPSLLLKEIDSVGYHCWIDEARLALVMITQPLSLDVASLTDRKAMKYAQNVGRCVLPVKDGKNIFYLKLNAPDSAGILMESGVPEKTVLVLPSGIQDYCVYYSERVPRLIIYSTEKEIRVCERTSGRIISACPLPGGAGKITRMALSADGRKLAFVAED